jgi:hypothetical protein
LTLLEVRLALLGADLRVARMPRQLASALDRVRQSGQEFSKAPRLARSG